MSTWSLPYCSTAPRGPLNQFYTSCDDLSVLTPNQSQVLIDVVDRIERLVLHDLRAGYIAQEEEVTGSLRTRLHDISESAAGSVEINVKILPSAGKNSEESLRGADMEGSLRLRVNGLDVRKGFLVQAKMAGKDGVRVSPPPEARPRFATSGDVLRIRPSGEVSLGKPSPRLVSQCEKMLNATPASFVWVYDLDQIAVVSPFQYWKHVARHHAPRESV